MDRETTTRLIAKLISVTQAAQLSWQKQRPRIIVAKDHATSAVYFARLEHLGFRVYRYKWERGDYYGLHHQVALSLVPHRTRGVILEIVDEDDDVIETVEDVSALVDLFDVVNREVSKIQEKIESILTAPVEK